MFGRGCDTVHVSSLQPCRIVVQISEAAFVTDMVTSNYVQPSSVVSQTEVSSASRLTALKGKFESVYTTPPAAGTNQSKVGSPRGRTVATPATAHSDWRELQLP